MITFPPGLSVNTLDDPMEKVESCRMDYKPRTSYMQRLELPFHEFQAYMKRMQIDALDLQHEQTNNAIEF